MATRKYRLRDKFNNNDNGGIRGEVILGVNRIEVPFIDPFGNPSFYSTFEKIIDVKKNIVPIGAYQFTFDKLFNIGLDQNTTLRVGDLNDEAPQMKIGVHPGNYKSVYYNSESTSSGVNVSPNNGINIPAMNFIFGFMMGDGGSKEDNITAIASDYKRRTLFRAVPFRMSNDGSNIDETKYFGKTAVFSETDDTITSYYIKTFDDPAPRIIHTWVSDNPHDINVVDDSVFASTSSIPIESFVEMNMTVNEFDGRGFFETNGSSSRINEFGLVSGWFNKDEMDYESIRLFTHFTRPSIALSPGDKIEAIYRLYAR